jgi:general secretion pathway protein J
MRQNRKGFTLLELLLALTISALMLVILASAMQMGYKSEEKASERGELSQTMRMLNDRLTFLLRGAYPYLRKTEHGPVLYFDGSSDSLGFVTTGVTGARDTLPDSTGMKWVKIYLSDGALMMRGKIYFLEDVFEDSGGNTVTLADEVERIEFEYLDRDDEKGTEEWVSEWSPEEKEYLPSAVKMTVTIIFKETTQELTPFIVKIEPRKRAT